MIDKNIFRDISYGMYIVGSILDKQRVGCVINTFSQVTSREPLISISLNKENYTNEVIRKTGKFAVSIVSEEMSREVIGTFGFKSSRDVDKYEGVDYEIIEDMPVLKENCLGYVICEVVQIIDANTHDIILAKVINSKKLNDKVPMTYKYYQEKLKGSSSTKAPTYVSNIDLDNSSASFKYRCRFCGYIYDNDSEEVAFEDLPENLVCPLCGASKSDFVKI